MTMYHSPTAGTTEWWSEERIGQQGSVAAHNLHCCLAKVSAHLQWLKLRCKSAGYLWIQLCALVKCTEKPEQKEQLSDQSSNSGLVLLERNLSFYCVSLCFQELELQACFATLRQALAVVWVAHKLCNSWPRHSLDQWCLPSNVDLHFESQPLYHAESAAVLSWPSCQNLSCSSTLCLIK